jgi:hypothetical protein
MKNIIFASIALFFLINLISYEIAGSRSINPELLTHEWAAKWVFVYCVEILQKPDMRKFISLNGEWHIIIDPYENGFYSYRYAERGDCYFKNAKPKNPSEFIEHDFHRSPTMLAPGDWNSQDDRLFFCKGTIWYYKEMPERYEDG